MTRWTPRETNLALAVAAFAAVVYTAIDARSPSDDEARLRSDKVFPTWRREDLTALTCRGPEGVLSLRRGEGAELVLGGGGASDPAVVDTLLAALENASVRRSVDAGGARGFDPPRVTCEAVLRGTRLELALGGDAPPPREGAYLRVGERFVVVSKELAAELLRPPTAYRDRLFVPSAARGYDHMIVDGPNGRVDLARLDGESFRLPSGARASRAVTEPLVRLVETWKAERLVPLDAGSNAGGPGDSPYQLTLDGPSRVELVVSPARGSLCAEGGLYTERVRPDPLAGCAPRYVLEVLAAARPSEDDHLFFARLDEVEEARWQTTAGAVLELARKGSTWRERAPEDRDLAGAAADAAAALVGELVRGAGELVAPPEPLPAVRGRVAVHRAGVDGPEVVELLAPTATGTFVRRVADGRVLRVRPEVASTLVPRPSSLASRRLFSEDLEHASVASLSLACGGVTQRAERRPQGLVLLEPAGYPADAATILDVAGALLRAKVERWLDPAEVPTDAFPPGCTARLTLEGTNESHGLTFGRDAADGMYTKRDDGAVAIVPRALRAVASRLLVDRHVLSVEASNVLRVTLTGKGRRVVVAASETGLRVTEGATTVPPSELTEALETLRADEVLHLGPGRPDEGFGAPSLQVVVDRRSGPPLRFALGYADVLRDTRIVFARVDGIDAVYAVARERVEPLLRAVSPP